jgi:transcriptional antiterminator RfaH
MSPMWYVAHTEPRAEFIAAEELELDGHDVFFPRLTDTDLRPGHNEVPLFPSYLFLRFDPGSKGWPSFSGKHRITGLVKFGNDVPCLPDSDIEAIKDLLETINKQGGAVRTFSTGEHVQVVSGVLQGFGEVIDAGKSPQARAKVLLQFMGRMLQVQVPWKNLLPIENQRRSRRTRGKERWIGGFKPVANSSR